MNFVNILLAGIRVLLNKCIIKKWRRTLNSDVIVRGSSYNFSIFSFDFTAIFIEKNKNIKY